MREREQQGNESPESIKLVVVKEVWRSDGKPKQSKLSGGGSMAVMGIKGRAHWDATVHLADGRRLIIGLVSSTEPAAEEIIRKFQTHRAWFRQL